MNCKPGDLAIIIGSKNKRVDHHVGKILKVVRPCKPGYWRTDPELISTNGCPISWHDYHLRPVSGLPLEEETEKRLKEPA